MRKYLVTLAILLMARPAFADSFGNGVIPVGPTKQVAATTSSASTTLTSVADYVLVWNEGSVFAYVTCTGSSAAVPGGSINNSTPVGPAGGMILNSTGFTPLTCSAITASSTANVDFTPVNLF